MQVYLTVEQTGKKQEDNKNNLYTGWTKKVSLLIFAITLSTAS